MSADLWVNVRVRSALPILIHEEVQNIDCVQYGHNYNGVCDEALGLVLHCNVGDVTIINSIRPLLARCEHCVTICPGSNTYIKVQAMIPGRPLWNNLKSQRSPNRGFSSTPM